MSYATDPRVDAYLDRLPDWQREICREVRDLVHAADPEVTETVKRTDRPYFVLRGNICALLAAKDHVNVFLYDGAIVPDPERIITSGHDASPIRTIEGHVHSLPIGTYPPRFDLEGQSQRSCLRRHLKGIGPIRAAVAMRRLGL